MESNLPLSKRYYSIGEVCSQLDVAPSLIRHWETVFGKLHTRRNGKGGRLFTPANIQHLTAIHRLVKDDRMTLEGAKAALSREQNITTEAIVQELEGIKAGLINLQKQINPVIKKEQ
jgi:DNA-binding transcriptional MerR regulator